jgi:hypothetical protein
LIGGILAGFFTVGILIFRRIIHMLK